MGISGLTSFMSRNVHLFRDFSLHDTKVVIDGNNLSHYIFKESNIDDTHGGDYDRYACEIREFFRILQSCNIEPYVLLDGGDDPSDKKFNTKLKRAEQRLDMAMLQSNGRGKKDKTMPVLANKTFFAVLLEIKVSIYVCDFEADKEIGLRANQLNCPVLSFDSDFYILPLNAGYIPFDKVFFKPQEGKREDSSVYHYLPAMIYHVDNFVIFFPALERNVLLLIALLLGNDYVDRDIFDPFYSSLWFDGDPTEFEFPTRFSKMGKLINWLKSLETYEEGIKKVVSTAITFKHEEIILSAIKITGNEFTLNNNIQNTDTILHPVLNGTNIPTWLVHFHRQGDLPDDALNILTTRRVFLRTQIEHPKSPSSHQCCAKLRKFMYSILLSEDVNGVVHLENRDEMVANEICAVEEYYRDGYKLIKNVVCPKISVKMFGKIPKLSEIPNLSASDREKTLRLALDIPVFDIEHMSKELEMILGIVLFWKRNAQPNATENHLKSILVCLIMLKVKSIVDHWPNGCEDNLIDEAILGMSNEARKEVNNQLLRFCHSRDHRVDTNLIHGFAELQACFRAAMELNSLLLCPFPSPCIFQIISGTFLYNFFVELQKRRNSDMFIYELLSRYSKLPKVYQSLYIAVMNSLL